MELVKLHFPEYKFTLKGEESGIKGLKIFDIVRKRYVRLSPEEWVRQHMIHFLIHEKGVPASLTAIEKLVMVNRLQRRFDILVYSKSHTPLLLVECKAPEIPVSQSVFDQAARYNLTLGALYFVLTNGLVTYCCKMDHQNERYEFLEELPFYENL